MRISRNGKLGIAAVVAVALVAAGAAFAATKLHTSSSANGGRSFGGLRGFPGGSPPNGYAFPGGRFRHDGGNGDERGFGFGPWRAGGSLSAAASYLGVSFTQLLTDLRSGKTLAQIANAQQGRSASGLVDAMVAAEQKEIAAAVKDGRLTQAHASSLAGAAKARIQALVNGTGRGGFFGRPGGFGGPPPGGDSAPATPPTTHI